MSSRRPPIPRTLATRPQAGTGHAPQPARHDAARLVRHTLIDFSSLPLPADVRLALAQAFWGHIGGHSDRSIASYWKSILPFARFAAESQSLRSVADLDRAMLVRYIEWLNASALVRGPVFRGIDRWGNLGEAGLHANSVIPLLRQALERAGIPAEQYTSHSLRRGFATWAHHNGWDLKSLMNYVGWKDVKSAMRYVEATPFTGMSIAAEKRIGP